MPVVGVLAGGVLVVGVLVMGVLLRMRVLSELMFDMLLMLLMLSGRARMLSERIRMLSVRMRMLMLSERMCMLMLSERMCMLSAAMLDMLPLRMPFVLLRVLRLLRRLEPLLVPLPDVPLDMLPLDMLPFDEPLDMLPFDMPLPDDDDPPMSLPMLPASFCTRTPDEMRRGRERVPDMLDMPVVSVPLFIPLVELLEPLPELVPPDCAAATAPAPTQSAAAIPSVHVPLMSFIYIPPA